MSKIITYGCDRCNEVFTSELKGGPIEVTILSSPVIYKTWTVMSYNEHLCSNCLETLEIAITSLVNNFVKAE